MTLLKNMRKATMRGLRAFVPGLARSRSRRAQLPAPVVPHPDRGGVAIVAIVKDEERYIAEWVNYHMLIGARGLYVYDNGSSDGTYGILTRGRWADRITVIPWRNFDTSIRMQNAAYNHAVANFGGRYRWMAFIDVDEFIVPKHSNDLDTALGAFEDIPAISLPWHMFGPSGHSTPPAGLVMENYLERAEFPPRPDVISLLNYKTIADPARIKLAKTHHVELIDDADGLGPSQGDPHAHPGGHDGSQVRRNRVRQRPEERTRDRHLAGVGRSGYASAVRLGSISGVSHVTSSSPNLTLHGQIA